MDVASFALELSFWFRLFSIIYNVIIFVMLYFKIKNDEKGGRQVNVLYIFTNRLKYYSIVLCLSRFFSTWYGFQYNFLAINSDPNASYTQNIIWFLSAIFTPSAGIGYFCVYLKMQPGALEIFKSIIGIR